MKYILLLILPLLSSAVMVDCPFLISATTASAVSSYVTGNDNLSYNSYQADPIQEDSIKTVLSHAFVVAPKDSFPIQVGAYKNKANAEVALRKIRHLRDIKIRIVAEEGLYKVRISRIPEAVNTKIPAAVGAGIPETTDSTITDTRIGLYPFEQELYAGSALYNLLTQPLKVISDTAEASSLKTQDDREIIFFKGNSPWLKRIKYFGESFTLVNALIITILISIITMITLLVIILFNRTKMEREEKLHQYLMERYQSLIVDYLFGSTSPDEFIKIASDNYSRQVLIDQMIDVSVNLKGEESRKLLGLYKYLGLDKDSLARAHDRRWHKKIKGFRELAFMNITDANDVIFKALNSSNEILRMEAQIALVRLSEEDHFEFLSHLRRPFSLWEQITLHDLIIQHNIPQPSFKKWLSASNDTVVLFALRMIREFSQSDAEEGIRDALHHKSGTIRNLAVQVAGDLGLASTLEIMKKMYKNEEYKTCLEIVKSMGKMPDPSMLGFLKLVLDKEDDVQLQIEATKSIEKMGEVGVEALVKIMKSEYKNYNIIVRHVLDRRIN
jgi:hypothetical protein